MCRLCRLCTSSSAQQIKRWKCFPQTKQKNADVQDHGAQLELDHRRDCGWQPGSLSFNFTAFVLFLFTSLIFPLFGALNSFRPSHLTLERKRGKCWSCRKDHYSIIPLMQCNEATTFSFLSFCGKKFCDKLCPVLDWHRFLWSSQKKWRSRHVSRDRRD